MALQNRLDSFTNKVAQKLNKLHGWTSNELTETNNLIIDVANMIPTDNVELENGAGYITGISNITQIPSRSYNDLQDKPDLDGLYVNASGDTMNGPLIISKTDTPGGTLFDIHGSSGQLFSITDSLEGDLFSVNDISGLPILNVHSENGVEIDGMTLAESFVVSGGTSNDFLKGDGSLDSNTYSLSTHTHSFNDLTDVPDLDDKRTVKVIGNTSQYTFIEEDFFEKFVVFTGNTTVTVYVADTLSPMDGEIRGIALGTTILKFFGSGVANLTSTEGTFKETSGEGSVFGVRATSTNNFYLYGDLKATEEYSLSNHNHDSTYVKKWETWTSNFNITGDILPTQNNTYDLGSSTKAFTNVYVGIGAIHVNGKKVIEDISNVMNITTALDNDIYMSTSGIGDLRFDSSGTGNIELNAVSGNILLNGETLFQAGKLIKSSDGSNLLFDDSIQFSANTGISGDLGVTGYTIATGFKTPSGTGTGFLKDNGTVDTTTYAPNNDSRINNGQTAYGWGDHAGLYSPTGHTHNYENPLTFTQGGATTVSRVGNTVTISSVNTTYSAMTLTELNTGTATSGRVISAKTLTDWGNGKFSSTGHNHSGVYEPVFTKNNAFNKNFGAVAGTVAQGNDSRILNGDTAYGWGDHALAGYAGTGHTHDYRWNLKTNGVQRTTVSANGGILDLVAGANVSLSYSAGGVVTISSTDDDTTYSAGSGLSLVGTTFTHGDTSTQGSVDNTAGTVIQDVLLDDYGHITGLTSYNLDNRYYTEAEVNTIVGNYLPLTGGTMSSNINFSNTNTGIGWSMNTDGAYIKFHNTSDGDTNSHMEFHTYDNGNEYFKWTTRNGATTYDLMTLKNTAGNLWVAGSVDSPLLKFSGQSTDDRYAAKTHSHSEYSTTGHTHSGVYEPVFTKNTGFNKNFGTTLNTVAQGNDSRIINGQTAYNWGDHAGLYSPIGHTHNYENPLTFQTTGAASVSRSGDTITIGATNTTYDEMTLSDLNIGSSTEAEVVSAKTLTDWGDARYSTPGHVHSEYSSTGHTHDGTYEPVFTKNTAFNKNFGTALGSVAQGNDSRIINGQTAYNWGDHSTVGYLTSVDLPAIVDNLTSISTTDGLSANQGRVLKGFIDNINNLLNSDNTALDTLQELVDYIEANRSTLESLSISNIAGLQTELTNLQNNIDNHTHNTSAITGGTLDYARLPFTVTNVNNWNTAYGWGDHAGLYSGINHNHNLNNLSDVMISAIGANEILKWNGSGWVNNTLAEAGIAASSHTHSTLTRGTGLTGSNYNGGTSTTWAVSYGTAAGTAAQGNDSRINNGQTAYGWGNHASAGYLTSLPAHDHDADYVNITGDTMNGPLTIEDTSTPGQTIFDIQGSAGQLFSITDSLEGDLFEVNDISGLPVLVVNSDDRVEIHGELNVKSGDLSGLTTTTAIASVDVTLYDAVHYDYVIKREDSLGMRTGTLMAVWDGTNIEFTDTSTNELGTVSGITLSVDISNGRVRLLATITSGTWTVKSGARTL